jgi:hypothetical protein
MRRYRMAKINDRIRTPVAVTPFDQTLQQELFKYTSKVSNVVNGGLNYEEHFNAKSVSVANTGVADTEFAVPHNMKLVPSGYHVIKNGNGGAVYDGTTPWTTTNVYLRCKSANNNITVLLFK